MHNRLPTMWSQRCEIQSLKKLDPLPLSYPLDFLCEASSGPQKALDEGGLKTPLDALTTATPVTDLSHKFQLQP